MVIVKRKGTILAISENGYGKRTLVDSYRKTHRGAKGVITIKTTERNGHLISLMEVVDNDDLMIITKKGIIIRQPVEKISIIGRATQGVRLINLYPGDKVHDIARIAAEDETIDSDELIEKEKIEKTTEEQPEE
jgi:DNA gyrase subunit A